MQPVVESLIAFRRMRAAALIGTVEIKRCAGSEQLCGSFEQSFRGGSLVAFAVVLAGVTWSERSWAKKNGK